MTKTHALKIFTAGLKKDLTAILFLRSLLTAKKRCTDVNALKKRNRQAPDAKKINAAVRDALQHHGCSEKKNQLSINHIPYPLKAERQSNLEGMHSRVACDRTK